jgi:hypothetical protein
MSQIGSSTGSQAFLPASRAPGRTGNASLRTEEGSPQANASVFRESSDAAQGESRDGALSAALFSTDLRLSAAQMTRLLRNLLQLPPDLVDMLALLAHLEEASTSKLLQTLLNGNVTVSLEELQALLLERLAQSEEKLMKLLQSGSMAAGASRDGPASSLFELLRIRRELAADAGQSPVEALRTLLLLYLPASGRNPGEEAENNGDDGENPADGKPEESVPLTEWFIAIQTVSLGAFQITLSLTRTTTALSPSLHPPSGQAPGRPPGSLPTLSAMAKPGLDVLVVHGPEALPVLEEIRVGLDGMMVAEHLPAPHVLFRQRKPPIRRAESAVSTLSGPVGPECGQAGSPSVSVQPARPASAIGIQWTYRLIRLILDLDNAGRPSTPAG